MRASKGCQPIKSLVWFACLWSSQASIDLLRFGAPCVRVSSLSRGARTHAGIGAGIGGWTGAGISAWAWKCRCITFLFSWSFFLNLTCVFPGSVLEVFSAFYPFALVLISFLWLQPNFFYIPGVSDLFCPF
jgi:hypothetical protein